MSGALPRGVAGYIGPRKMAQPEVGACKCTSCDVSDDVRPGIRCEEPDCDGYMVRCDHCDRCDEPMHYGDGSPSWVEESSEVCGVCEECVTPKEWLASHGDDRSEA